MKRASIKDIARIAGVSVATVSYVLNKKAGSVKRPAIKFLKLQRKSITHPIKSPKALK